MSDYNFQVFTPDGKSAISSLYNSYYIASESTGSTSSQVNFNIGQVPTSRFVTTIQAPVYTNANLPPLLLLKNTNKSSIGCYSINHNNGIITSWTVIGDTKNGLFDYAIAVAETGYNTTEPYGIKMFAENGVDVLFDSRRKQNLTFLGTGGIASGYFEEGNFNVSVNYDYFTAPMAIHRVWVNYSSSPGIYGYVIANVCFKGTGPNTGYAVAIISGYGGSPIYVGANGGNTASTMMFFSKV